METDHANPPLLAVVGPTAVGKSALAIELCEALGGEVVTADSRQVYRFMDIGTDKPGAADRERVPHHMIDLVDPDESFTLAMYQDRATEVISNIQARGLLPVLAGGTPLYVNSIVEGWKMPRVEPNQKLRRELEAQAGAAGVQSLHDRLRELDAAAAGRILPTNTRRIIRALEVIAATGRPISEQQSKFPPPYGILTVVLDCERTELYARIDRRVDSQIDRGLVEEVRGLVDRGYSLDLPSMSGLGYRQIGEYLRGRATLQEAIQRDKWDTHAFVRHQQNWFRRLTEALRFDVTEGTPTGEIIAAVREWQVFARHPSGAV